MLRAMAGLTRVFIASVLGAMVGCGNGTSASGSSALSVTNPTGSCKAPDDGGRRGYHSPGAGAVWLPDCQGPLEREYWRVFAVSNTSAYIIPQPAGAPEFAAVCGDSEHELHSLVEKYALCQLLTSETLPIANDIDPADALALTHYLHTVLLFEVVQVGIDPYPFATDIIDACNLHPDANSPAFVELCEREQARLDSGHLIGFTYEDPANAELVARLNELYGIEACEVRLREAGKRFSALLHSVERACEVDADCSPVSLDVACLAGCGGMLVAAGAAEGFEAAIEQFDESICGPFLDAGCKRPPQPGCPPPGHAPGCIAGLCQ